MADVDGDGFWTGLPAEFPDPDDWIVAKIGEDLEFKAGETYTVDLDGNVRHYPPLAREPAQPAETDTGA